MTKRTRQYLGILAAIAVYYLVHSGRDQPNCKHRHRRLLHDRRASRRKAAGLGNQYRA